MLFVSLLAAAYAACPSLDAELDAAESALRVLDLPTAESYLDTAEASLACGTVPSDAELARFYFLDGTVAQFTGDASAARLAYVAARDLDPLANLAGFETATQDMAAKASAERPSGTGSIDVNPSLAEPWRVRIDGGEPVSAPAAVMEGLHLVQFTDEAGSVFEGKVVLVTAGTPVVVSHELPATPPEPERVRNPIATEGTLRLGVGGSFAFGESLSATVDGVEYAEPAFKATTPASLGFEVKLGPAFFELEGELGALLDGYYLVADTPAPAPTKLGWGVGLHAGADLGAFDLGLGGGGLFPGRYRGYALARFTPFRRAPVSIAARAGVRAAHRLGAEPMFGLTVAYDLGLF